jgi:AraC-like DNA-binding protein
MHVQDISHEVGYNRNSYEHNGLWSKCTGESPSTQAHMKEKKKEKKKIERCQKKKRVQTSAFSV